MSLGFSELALIKKQPALAVSDVSTSVDMAVQCACELRGFCPQVSAADIRRSGRANACRANVEERGCAKSAGARLFVCRAARDWQNIDRANSGQSAQLREGPNRNAVRCVRQLPRDRSREFTRRNRDRWREQ